MLFWILLGWSLHVGKTGCKYGLGYDDENLESEISEWI